MSHARDRAADRCENVHATKLVAHTREFFDVLEQQNDAHRFFVLACRRRSRRSHKNIARAGSPDQDVPCLRSCAVHHVFNEAVNLDVSGRIRKNIGVVLTDVSLPLDSKELFHVGVQECDLSIGIQAHHTLGHLEEEIGGGEISLHGNEGLFVQPRKPVDFVVWLRFFSIVAVRSLVLAFTGEAFHFLNDSLDRPHDIHGNHDGECRRD